MSSLEEAVIKKLKLIQYHLCTVESCTGGLVSHLITNVTGASQVFWGGSVVYDNSAKRELGVQGPILEEFGAVSSQVAKALAESGLRKLQSNPWRPESPALIQPLGFICLSTTGFAGPEGRSQDKPVGLCFIGLAISGQKTVVEEYQATGKDRLLIKSQFAQRALELLLSNCSLLIN